MLRRGVQRIKPEQQFSKWKILRGDKVEVIAGKDRGKQGNVIKVDRKTNRVIVEGCGLVKKHIAATPGQAGGIATKESAIHVSNVSLVDPSTGQPTKVSVQFTATGEKVRVAKKSGQIIPRPELLLVRKRPKEENPDTDTKPSQVLLQTYFPDMAATIKAGVSNATPSPAPKHKHNFRPSKSRS